MARSQRDLVIQECSAKPDAVEDYPFGDDVAVFKVGGKMFALMSLDAPPGSPSLKCDPGLAVELRTRYAVVTAGYRLSKRHWNTIILEGQVPEDELLDLVEHRGPGGLWALHNPPLEHHRCSGHQLAVRAGYGWRAWRKSRASDRDRAAGPGSARRRCRA